MTPSCATRYPSPRLSLMSKLLLLLDGISTRTVKPTAVDSSMRPPIPKGEAHYRQCTIRDSFSYSPGPFSLYLVLKLFLASSIKGSIHSHLNSPTLHACTLNSPTLHVISASFSTTFHLIQHNSNLSLPLMSSSPHYKGEIISAVTVRKDSGKIILRPQALDIIWGADSRYWRIPNKSKEGEPAELLQVSWLEVSGFVMLDELVKGKEYTVSFKVSMKPDAFGWAGSPVYLMAKAGKNGKYNWKKADLSSKKAGETCRIPEGPVLRFSVPNNLHEGEKLLFGMYETWRRRWKGGLQLHEVIIEPYKS